jgi:hypothetical protein
MSTNIYGDGSILKVFCSNATVLLACTLALSTSNKNNLLLKVIVAQLVKLKKKENFTS